MSCVTLPGGDPCPCRIIFITVIWFEFFRINWVMLSWQMVLGYLPCKPMRPRFRCEDSSTTFRGGVSKTPCFYSGFCGPPLNLGVKLHPLNLKAYTVEGAWREAFATSRPHPISYTFATYIVTFLEEPIHLTFLPKRYWYLGTMNSNAPKWCDCKALKKVMPGPCLLKKGKS